MLYPLFLLKPAVWSETKREKKYITRADKQDKEKPVKKKFQDNVA